MTRIGLFGLLGSGNLGNDGSLRAMLDHLGAAHPDARIDALCGGPEWVRATYGIEATALYRDTEFRTASGVRSAVAKVAGKLGEVVRTAAWVRRHDLVIVPGMGVLEATLPLRPWGFPYSLFLLCLSGRLFGTPVALVSVGAGPIRDRAIRWLVTRAARLAAFRSYRDARSRDALAAMGVDVSRDRVYPDLAFALPTPDGRADTGCVGVGVMAYRGGPDDRARAEEIHADYLAKVKALVRRLVEDGRSVRLFVGDRLDSAVVDEVMADLPVTAAEVSTLDELLGELAGVDVVVASRFHNVLCALKLGRPTVSLGYAAKNDVLMDTMGLGAYCHSIRDFDVDRVLGQVAELERRAPEVTGTLLVRAKEQRELLDEQFAHLATLLPTEVRA
ncbi:polysaccharide pyruvyl transferase family protein [Actinophytocola gossypii]|uniref:Polysaccharide pyruvyl transferase family protein n=1 Tax=Actinophytocola gossypii TaxID=2812003 RepID=A0ABT2JER6_9PSEU|nr:polysaccharide pyruvyl transferase family protein [Actinophytocola gossypii]MCT2585759.1 polysaccharide pyruvyl transferase family protein [Actinophytocola gossypii]